jgi:hypothetical protein
LVDDHNVAIELSRWFETILALCDRGLFVGGDDAHRQAAVLGTLTQNARQLAREEIDAEGKLYPPLLLTLAAICRRLQLTPGPKEWLAAIRNVRDLRPQLQEVSEAAPWLLSGRAVEVFKRHMDEALVQAGVTDRATILASENRRLALGLALNWGMRTLIAYALEQAMGAPSEKQDLAWLRGLLADLSSPST